MLEKAISSMVDEKNQEELMSFQIYIFWSCPLETMSNPSAY